MSNPQFTKPWHGVSRENIDWNPTILEDACIGCGTCVTGCSRMVYRFDFERKKPIVVDPLNCMVGCTTCANTCPAHAITFPSLESILALEGLPKVRHAVEDDLISRHDILTATALLPHPDKIITLVVSDVSHPTSDIIRVVLKPMTQGECFCEFTPGQYIELWQPESTHLSRAYSIANSPHGDGRIELHIRRVDGGRFSEWVFNDMKVGDRLQARGPLGAFTMRSPEWVPLLFIAGGTGIAPILAMLEQQIKFDAARNMYLIWGMRKKTDFYAVDLLKEMLAEAPNLRLILTAEIEDGTIQTEDRLEYEPGTVISVLQSNYSILAHRDIYTAGPPVMLREMSQILIKQGIASDRIHTDSFGT